MDCTAAEWHIQRELDTMVLGDDDRFGAPAKLTGAETRALDEHCAVCPDCADLRVELRAIDAALAANAVEKAPAWLATAVMREVSRPAATGRFEPAVVTVGAVLGSIATVTTLVRTGALAGVAGPIGRFSSSVNIWIDRLTSAATTSPGVEVVRSFQPGDVAVGVIWALAAVSAAFLAVSALRLSKELTFGARRVFSR